ncbi:MAG: AraC family transcriptional regulator [Lachnospiraceae bacterium]|nr:AraC family transcriptional regulator [Lachnospiraceae bacterium]
MDNKYNEAKEGIPVDYRQPRRPFVGRNIENSLEKVDYVPNSHLRIWYNNKNEDYAVHHHDAAEIILIIKGKYKAIVDRMEYDLEEGDILIIPPYMLHELRYVEDGGLRFIGQFDLGSIVTYQDYVMMGPLFNEAYLCSKTSHGEIYQKLYDIYSDIINIYFKNDDFWEMRIFSRLLEFYSVIGTDYTQNPESDESQVNDVNKDVYKKLSFLLNYIDTNYAEDITLDEAARMIGFSKFYFTRIFKNYTKTSFHNYLMNRRILSAQSMLSNNMPITDAAYQSGFKTLATFSRAFKNYTNLTPKEYKNKMKK